MQNWNNLEGKKMNKSKLETKLIIVATLGILILSFTSVVQGAQTERIRPIDDWIYGNDHDSWDPMDKQLLHNWWKGDDWDKSLTVEGNPFGAWRGFGDLETLLLIHFDWVALNDEIEYDGFVLETEMPDGSFKIRVNLHVQGIYMEVYRYSEEFFDYGGAYPFWIFIEELILFGTMDYTFEFEFILEREIPGGQIPFTDIYIQPGIREPGAELPSLADIWFYPYIFGARDLFFKFTGVGSGELVEPGWLPPTVKNNPQGFFLGKKQQPEFWWFIPPKTEIPEDQLPVSTGETAKVKINQKTMIKPRSPNFYWGWVWPVVDGFELIKIF